MLELYRDPNLKGSTLWDAAADLGPERASVPPRVIAISGAKGGVGKSTLVANIALYLATLGRRVLAVDGEANGADLRLLLGISENGHASQEGEQESVEGKRRTLGTPFPGLSLMESGLDEPRGGSALASRRRALARILRTVKADYVILDLGSGADHSLVDMYLESSLALFVTTPEPASIQNTYRFAKAALLRRVFAELGNSADRSRWARLVPESVSQFNPDVTLERLRREEPYMASVLEASMRKHIVYLVVNQVRVRADNDLGHSMATAAWQRLGIRLEVLGTLDFDDNVWSCTRRRRPLIVENAGTKVSKSIEKISRRVLAIDSGKITLQAPTELPRDTHYALLELTRHASEEEVRRAYKRACTVYEPGSLCCESLFSESELNEVRNRIEQAKDTLLDASCRRTYEASIFGAEAPKPQGEPATPQDRGTLPRAPEISPETEFTGPLLRSCRESRGIELREISQTTKIGLQFLEAIEDEQFHVLPASTYVRGFVSEFAKSLGLDPLHVSRTYMRRVKRRTMHAVSA